MDLGSLQLPVCPTVRVTVKVYVSWAAVGAGAPASLPLDPLPAVTFFGFRANQTACFPASGTQPSPVIPCCPRSSCRKLHVKDCLSASLWDQGSPVPGQQGAQADTPICLVVGQPRAEGREPGRGRDGRVAVGAGSLHHPPHWSHVGLIMVLPCRAGSRSREPSGQRSPSPSFWFQPGNFRPNVACPLFLAKTRPPGASNGDGMEGGCGSSRCPTCHRAAGMSAGKGGSPEASSVQPLSRLPLLTRQLSDQPPKGQPHCPAQTLAVRAGLSSCLLLLGESWVEVTPTSCRAPGPRSPSPGNPGWVKN